MVSFGELLGAEIRAVRTSKGWTQLALALKAFEPDSAEHGERRIRDYEGGKVKNPQSRVYVPICDALGITQQRIGQLLSIAGDKRAVNRAEIEILRSEKGSLERALSDLRSLNRNQLESLASVFEIEKAYDLRESVLLERLANKAKDYSNLRAEVEAIDDDLKRLSNLKHSARAAIDSGELAEVELLLSRVQEIELEEASKTAELRSMNALLRGDPTLAFKVLSASADSFAAMDELLPLRRRIEWEEILFDHGRRYDGEGLLHAVEMMDFVVEKLVYSPSAQLLGEAHFKRAMALTHLGSRTSGDIGSASLLDAVASYRIALARFEEAQKPQDWARTQSNLSFALKEQGARTGGADGERFFLEAAECAQQALRVFTKDETAPEWSLAMSHLGLCFLAHGVRTETEIKKSLFSNAIDSFRSVFHKLTRENDPKGWARNNSNLAISLHNLGLLSDGVDATELLSDAVAAFEATLEVYTFESEPYYWADGQNNLGNALRDLGVRLEEPESKRFLLSSVNSFCSALTVFAQDTHSVDWALTHEYRAEAEEALAELKSCPNPQDRLMRGLADVEIALDVYDPESMPYDYQTASELKKRLKSKLNES